MNENKFSKLIRSKFKYIGVCLGILLILIFAGRKTTVQVFNQFLSQAERKLPIYCVDTDEKKVAISFDAAWGGYNLR